ncbi:MULTISPECIES: alanyl-tRNA synthetase [Leuconostoc]|uniref:alanyl-tRNA synthetase n=1 Tax=Leuconostoc TaxID=1243 RepID=UPI001CBB4847|nr:MULTISPECIES: alanyl-tRNA synthetase [Leuconostoc]MBZ1511006.1 alanyl-tRNA synthetase [Leuconostoc mesenteroides]MCT3056216.1 alanyl-tRNA synthetase [Leuconostoc citreum]MCT3058887.1 alanyl-tRNA synthetase [Leuconostoc citreum]MCT3060157.1 alanyl-tRNA synthetase [Leuconostoc citreum]
MNVTINRQARDVMADKDELLEQVKSEKSVKNKILSLPFLIIGFLVIVFGPFMLYAMTHQHVTNNSSSSQTSTTTKTKRSSSKYVAGKDYKITYNNQGVIDKATLDKGLKVSYLTDVDDLMDTSSNGSNMVKVEVYYNKDKNLLVERLFENGYKDNQPTQTVGYDLSEEKMNLDKTDPVDYLNQPLVYKWEKLTK